MTYDDVLTRSASFLNDSAKSVATNSAQFPYLNTALSELQEMFQLNNIPVTQKSSAVINVPEGTTSIPFAPDPPIVDTPYLPDDLVEINELFSSAEGQESWFPVTKKEYLTSEIMPSGAEISFIRVWAWLDQEIQILACNQDNDIKLDYIKTLFPIIDSENVDDDMTIINADTFLAYRTAALFAEFSMENPERAASLNGNASLAIDRSLGISTKGKQSIIYRRRPFRAAWKRRGILI